MTFEPNVTLADELTVLEGVYSDLAQFYQSQIKNKKLHNHVARYRLITLGHMIEKKKRECQTQSAHLR